MSKKKLKPCPFCGAKEVTIIKHGLVWKSGVRCDNCETIVYFYKNGVNVSHGRKGSAATITRAYNRRAK